ncbi:MAG: bacterial transcriptional activator domain-containing protein [Gemmatimonadetes bacterium]|nr:bacterial transcriptional activator domain-containing protein [Gemmatimonadota bacterium]
MFRLKLFGSAFIDGPAGRVTGRAVQRRRLGLLALLAVAGERGMTRDRLVGYLWPDSDGERARHLLSDSVYRINQAVGGEAVVAVGDELRARALEALAERAERDGAAVDAVMWWRLLAAQDPWSSRIALRLMRALDSAGERVVALQHAHVHAQLLEKEMGLAPDPELLAFVAELRTPAPESRQTQQLRPRRSRRSQRRTSRPCRSTRFRRRSRCRRCQRHPGWQRRRRGRRDVSWPGCWRSLS